MQVVRDIEIINNEKIHTHSTSNNSVWNTVINLLLN